MFSNSDRNDAPLVALINQKLARQYFGNEDPIGKYVGLDTAKGVTDWRQIVGIISDVRQESLDKPAYAELLIPFAQTPTPSMAVVLRASGGLDNLVAAARREVHALDNNLPVYNIRTMDELTSESLSDRNFQTWFLSSFAVLALLLAAIGVYGVMTQVVTQRTSEFSIRMALGAQRGQILGMVLSNALRFILIGIACGAAASLLLGRFLESFLYGVSSYDPLTIVAVAGLLAVVALFACYIPARRAMRIGPLLALRYE